MPWLFGRLPDAVTPAVIVDQPLTPDRSYVNVLLRSLHLADVRRGTRRFHGMVSCSSTLVSMSGGGRATFTAVSVPDSLRALDADHLDRVVVTGTRLLGPRPYRGGDLSVDLALLSVREADLAEPFLRLLTGLADVAGVGLLGSAVRLAPPLVDGLNNLLQQDTAALEVGAAVTWDRPEVGAYAVVRQDADALTPADLSLTEDFRLLERDGLPVRAPYVVFTVQSSTERADWYSIPEIAAAWEDVRNAVQRGRHDDIHDALAVLRRNSVLCPDLLPADGERLAELGQDLARKALPAGPTSAGQRRALPDLQEVPLYS